MSGPLSSKDLWNAPQREKSRVEGAHVLFKVAFGGGGGLATELCSALATPWTVAHQAPLFMEFSRQEYWSGLPFPSPGHLPDSNIDPHLLHCRQILY